ncbi:MAG: valine--tRNA ligase [Candidatus Aureabacteria bacterium]|nr:valine--tRNA ligase [Candidatus Auribacterota bacterium]
MSREIEPQYNPEKYEDAIFKLWLESGAFHSDSKKGGEPYSIVIPPPNVTGILHMGHALNNTIQDILVRRSRMQGKNTVWMPGTDHAGIATQNVVERKLKGEGKTKEGLGREAFIKEVWTWKEHHGNTIINQLKQMGCSCDWERERFTMDEGLSRAVAEVFVRLYHKGLIYRGNYIINWCPRCLTALSDEEAEHKETKGKLWYIKYPLKDRSGYITVATTRPETMLGDTAVAVAPDDERYKKFIGKEVILPVVERVIPVISDEWVDKAFGTGAVKVTPAHDPNDFEIGLRHDIAPLNVMEPDGIMNENAGKYKGIDRFKCRKELVRELEKKGLLEKTEDHQHSIRHCYRCHTVVEPRISEQWFVRMKPLAEPAIQVVRQGRIRFYPERWTKVYLDWMENIRDWCISRQIWWGHRIPVYYCDECHEVIVSHNLVEKCTTCSSSNIRQDEDVLDTWFSSWLWPFSTFGWPEDNADLKFYYPTDSLITAQEIIFFWVARMITAGMEFMGGIPFKKVYIHGTIRDETGRKMSKSLGNTIDPVDIIREYGADALRFSLIMITAQGQDVFLSSDKFEIGRNYANKIWNAFRFITMNTKGELSEFHNIEEKISSLSENLNTDDRYILFRLSELSSQVDEAVSSFRFNEAAHALYDFFWHSFCDKYIEFSKELLADVHPERERTLAVLIYVLKTFLRLLHPFMPFLTEIIWQILQEEAQQKHILMSASWPKVSRVGSEETAALVEKKYDLLRIARNIRSEYKIAPSKKLEYIIRTSDGKLKEYLSDQLTILMRLLNSHQISLIDGEEDVRPLPSGSTSFGTVYLKLTKESMNFEEELGRLARQLSDVEDYETRISRKLKNQKFIEKAPKEVVDKERSKLEDALARKTKIKENIHMLQSLSS